MTRHGSLCRASDASPSLSGPFGQPVPFHGGDLEVRGVFEAALAARAPRKELIFLCVGDTRDHRRMHKDPQLKNISVEFLLNLLANLRRLGLNHYMILTTRTLCYWLQRQHCQYACAWSSRWHDHPRLATWGLKPGDMFLQWTQQWHYIARAMALGYAVLCDSSAFSLVRPCEPRTSRSCPRQALRHGRLSRGVALPDPARATPLALLVCAQRLAPRSHGDPYEQPAVPLPACGRHGLARSRSRATEGSLPRAAGWWCSTTLARARAAG